jgi:hypothetical protein
MRMIDGSTYPGQKLVPFSVCKTIEVATAYGWDW